MLKFLRTVARLLRNTKQTMASRRDRVIHLRGADLLCSPANPEKSRKSCHFPGAGNGGVPRCLGA